MPKVKEFEAIGGIHGVSCIIPTLKDVIDFESGNIILNRGYPRFVIHPFVTEIINKHKKNDNEYIIPVMNKKLALFLLKEYISKDKSIVIEDYCKYAILRIDDEAHYKTIFEAVRNAGIILNSRIAQSILQNKILHCNKTIIENVKTKLSSFEKGSKSKFTYLFPTGMSAIFSSIISNFHKNKPHIVMVGNPYVDTRHILEKLPLCRRTKKTTFIEDSNDINNAITDKTGFVFIEFPTNPLIRVADLEYIINTAHAKNIPVIIDSTIASPYNINPIEYGADIVIHSTTKFLNAMNNHIGGVVFINPNKKEIAEKLNNFQSEFEFYMNSKEAETLLPNLSNFEDRMQKINSNAIKVAEFLESHPNIEKVYYPRLKSHQDYNLAQKYMPKGSSGLISFVLKNSCYKTAEAFYDNCTLPGKGPSLGSEQTLLCPITLLSFFDADDAKLKEIGQDRYTMRISVGTEPYSEICKGLENGLNAI